MLPLLICLISISTVFAAAGVCQLAALRICLDGSQVAVRLRAPCKPMECRNCCLLCVYSKKCAKNLKQLADIYFYIFKQIWYASNGKPISSPMGHREAFNLLCKATQVTSRKLVLQGGLAKDIFIYL